MAVQVSWPGVYIDEFAPGAPIQGVGTGVAGFVGVASQGPLLEPVKVTSFDQFTALYGSAPLPGFYLWYAVRGFFRNGGQACYVVRATNGQQATAAINSRAAPNPPVYRVTMREAGAAAGGDNVTVAMVNTLPATAIYRPSGALTAVASPGSTSLQVAAATAAFFKPGDTITSPVGETLTIAQINGTNIRLRSPTVVNMPNGTVIRLADLQVGDRVVRIAPAAQLAPGVLIPGSMVTLMDGANWAGTSVVSSVQIEPEANGLLPTYRVTLRDGLTRLISRAPGGGSARTMQSEELDVTVVWKGASRTYSRVSESAGHPRYLIDVINGDPDGIARIALIEPPPLGDALGRLAQGATFNFAGGAVENLTVLAANHLTGALDLLLPIDDVNLVCVPDRPRANVATGFPQVQRAMIDHCEQTADRFAVLDCGPGMAPFGGTGVEGQRATVESARGYAGLYYPWLRVAAADGGAPVLAPPCGHIAGVMARTDASRGVHKAPAGEEAGVRDALGVERRLSLVDHGILNLQGINVVQVFKDGAQPLVWGARTTAADRNWQYTNIRRLFLFLEESIQEGIRWAVFEPNNLELWQKLRRSISSFLTQQWRAGALFGAKKEDAFYVRIDEVLNPFSEQALGRLNIEIGVRPSYPAEFIIVRIGIWDGGAEVSE